MPRTWLSSRSRHCSVAQWTPDLGDGLGIVAAAVDGAQEPARDAGPQGQLGHPGHVLARGDRHDARDDRHADAGQLAALAEVVEIVVGEEELGADVIGAGVDLPLEVIQLLKPVGRAGVPLGKAGDADAETARVGQVRARAR